MFDKSKDGTSGDRDLAAKKQASDVRADNVKDADKVGQSDNPKEFGTPTDPNDFKQHNDLINAVEKDTNPANNTANEFRDLSDDEVKRLNEQNKTLGVREGASEAVTPNAVDPQHPVQNVAIPPADERDVLVNGVLGAEVPNAEDVSDVAVVKNDDK